MTQCVEQPVRILTTAMVISHKYYKQKVGTKLYNLLNSLHTAKLNQLSPETKRLQPATSDSGRIAEQRNNCRKNILFN